MSKKQGLKVRDVSKDHFSSGKNHNEPKFSRLVVRMLEGSNLLASDITTGKSDPVCFLWLGPISETPVVEKLASEEHDAMFAKTIVCPTTVDPIWNEDVVFELQVADIQAMMDQKCVIFVRDEDIEEDGSKSYDELGMVEFSMKEVVSRGRGLKSSIVLPATWYDLKKSPGMRRVDGRVKLTISLIFTNEDAENISHQLSSLSPLMSGNQQPGIGPLIQSHFKDPSLLPADPADMRISTNSLRQSVRRSGSSPSPVRQSSDNASVMSSSSRYGGKRPKSAHIIRRRDSHSTLNGLLTSEGDESEDDFMGNMKNNRPQTAPNRRYEMNPLREEDDVEDDSKVIQKETTKEEEEEKELIVIPNKKSKDTDTKENVAQDDLLLANPPPAGDQNMFADLIGNAISDGLAESIGFGADNLVEQASDALHFTAKNVGKGLQKIASIATPQSSKLPGVKLGASSLDNNLNSALDVIDLPSVDLPDKNNQARAGGIALLRGNSQVGNNHSSNAGPTGGASATNKAHRNQGDAATDSQLSRTANSGAAVPAAGTAAAPGMGNAAARLFGNNPLAIRISSPANSVTSKSKEKVQDDEHAAYERYKNLHQKHAGLLSEIGLPSAGDQDVPEEETNEMTKEASNANILDKSSSKSKDKENVEGGNEDIVITNKLQSQTAQDSNVADELSNDLVVDSQNAQGNTTAVVRLLREMKQQRQDMQEGFMQLARATEAGFRTITQRIHHLEEDQSSPEKKKKKPIVNEKLLLENGPSGGDEGAAISDLEDDEEAGMGGKHKKSSSHHSNKSQRNSSRASLNKTAPASTDLKDSSWKKPKAAARSVSNFRQFRQQQRDVYTPIGGGGDIPLRQSAKNDGPGMQLVYRDASGGISAAQVNQQGPMPSLSPAKEVSTLPTIPLPNTMGNSTGYYPSQPPTSPLRSSYENSNVHASSSGGVNSALNRDFCEVLDKGSLEDVARLLESTAAKPEVLAISTRNRVYDIISTLLLQRKHTERALIWITALLRPTSNSDNNRMGGGASIFRELTPHTQRDLLQAVHVASTEASKRGVLASLLYSQIDRAMSLA